MTATASAAASASGAATGPQPAARPLLRLGAESPGGLALPAANATAGQLYAPRGVHLGPGLLVAADTGNHRLLIWHGVPTADGAPADVVLGQPDATGDGAAASGEGPAAGFRLPTGVTVIDGDLHVCDAWHHRVLVYEGVPSDPGARPAHVIGQDDLLAVEPNRGGEPDAASFYWPFGIAHVAGWTWVTDTGNRRVMGWRGRLEPGRAADVVLGQDDAVSRRDNRGGPPDASSMRWPHAVTGDAETLLVADAGNHRVLAWSPHPGADGPASLALGQPDLATTAEWAYGPQGPAALRFPYGTALDAGRLAVADTANNRVLVWDEVPTTSGAPAQAVLGQADAAANGENRWESVRPDTLCWPYGLALHGRTLAVADSGNNRVVLWSLG